MNDYDYDYHCSNHLKITEKFNSPISSQSLQKLRSFAINLFTFAFTFYCSAVDLYWSLDGTGNGVQDGWGIPDGMRRHELSQRRHVRWEYHGSRRYIAALSCYDPHHFLADPFPRQ